MKRRDFLTRAALVLAARPGRVAASAPDSSRAPGGPMHPLSDRAPPEKPGRSAREAWQGMALTPLETLSGTITPADLHFTRHHAGIPSIDPASYRLLLHGMVERPLVLTLAELERLPSRSRIGFIECSGNGAGVRRQATGERSPGDLDGATSNSEWTGVPLRVLFGEAGIRAGASWLVAQSQDGAGYARSFPLAPALEEGMVAWAQNGEPLRAEQGYPARLFVPGWEGSAQVKWLRRLELCDGPRFFREETSRYADLLPDGKIHGYRLIMEAKSIITHPAWPTRLTPGWWEIRGLAWSGRGRIARVEVSTDGGVRWSAAELDEPVLPKAHTRFRMPWRFAGQAALLMSRAVDESGRAQPLVGAQPRQPGSDYHNNEVRAWRVEPDGSVRFEVPA